ncbi:hypothetical protein SCP_0408630 [Sparassis crispa]|uniref:RING-type domain-containing protein n=1 Tax=Sparassis crispa TaxID=139825 RepID=A0A401GK06_9APHY|nr:hypothetical protein SCP_0408630 [Sparassis crispa]GBE82479.1 hypothetical protein SCP_0408630 [Sparassis crispa]
MLFTFRLFNLSSIFATVWFAVAVIGIYSHSYRCRLAAPHLSWVTFAIACILYLRFIKLLLLPAYRICVRSARTDKAVPGKLTQSRVDRIPLVLYIPPPPEDAFESTSLITVPSPTHAYPPGCLVPIRPSPSGLKRRFIFLRSLRKRKDINALKGSKEDVQGNRAYAQAAWEDLWERGEHPLVRLEGQRSTCGICLMDFEAPKRILPIPEEGAESAEELADARADAEADQNGDTDAGAVQEVQVEPARQDDTHRVALADSGEGPQPLRLLGCGHAFHEFRTRKLASTRGSSVCLDVVHIASVG